MRTRVAGMLLGSCLVAACADEDLASPNGGAPLLPPRDAAALDSASARQPGDANPGSSTDPLAIRDASPGATGDASSGAPRPPPTEAGVRDAGASDSSTADARDAAACSDPCPKAHGVDWLCRLRFMYGVNYAWHHFGADFGGNARWMQPGVSGNPKVDAQLAQLAANGVSVVRWWVFPDFRGDGVTFDASDRPTGLGGTLLADVARALSLAQQHDLYLMLTLFSFDNFRPTSDMPGGVRSRSIKPLITDAAQRANLMEKVVRPLARAAAASPHRERLIAWDAINEPEWAIRGSSPYGDPAFDPNPQLESVSHAEMETFLRDVLTVLRAESDALLSVGSAAIKWGHAWDGLDVDFYQFHIYDWVDMYWPYDRSPTEFGFSQRPVVMGEFPGKGLARAGYSNLLQSWYGDGYAGALAWSYTDGLSDLSEVKRFAAQHPCELKY
ncbi:MAG TPA: hypothetical protein VFZ61_16575 [Polyangiales bacterium]